MNHLPITHMTLYKHGVGFFERRGQVSADKVELTLRDADMNDVLKSLTVIDWGDGQVLGVSYATPQSVEARLSGCSIHLDDEHSLHDLLVSLRGRKVTLALHEDDEVAGRLLGIDQAPEREPLATALVSLLLDDSARVQVFPLGRVQGLSIEDARGAADLRFFLDASLSQEKDRTLNLRLTPGDHDLSVSYVAPAPTWRVSYRLATQDHRALLQGWGIFDNSLEEDLEEISLVLTAGMPISFIYDLYAAVTPERPYIREEGRVAAGPVALGAGRAMAAAAATRALAMPEAERGPRVAAESMQDSVAAIAAGEELGELFQYQIETPVTVGRGQSAMVPIISTWLDYRKDLIYNGRKQPKHPVATLRLRNETGLTLERGPVTVLDQGAYVGEAVLPFTPEGGELLAPYAVELGVSVREEQGEQRQTHSLRISGAYLRIETWEIRWRQYRLSNHTNTPLTVLVEHPRSARYELFDSPQPFEQTDDAFRFQTATPAGGEEVLRVQERRLSYHREELQKQTYQSLQRYLEAGLMDRRAHDQIVALLKIWEQIDDLNAKLTELDAARETQYKAQKQIQGNMSALGTIGKEGALRSRYVDELQASEAQLKALAGQETEIKGEIERLKADAKQRLEALV